MRWIANPFQNCLNQIVVDGADFDGTNDYMTRGAGLTGIADGYAFFLSCYVRFDAGTGEQVILGGATTVGGTTLHFKFGRRTASGAIFVDAYDSAGAVALSVQTASNYAAAADWKHVLVYGDCDGQKAGIYVNDVDDTAGGTTYGTGPIDFTLADWAVGATPGGTLKFNGALAEPVLYANGSVPGIPIGSVYRRQFTSALNNPIIPLPISYSQLYLHLDNGEAVANFATNRGTGGNFSITGTLDTASTSPSD